jgi:hypothetical protein
MTTRSEVYSALDGERDYQDRKYPAVNGYSATPEGFLLVLEELVSLARYEATQGHLPPLGDGSVIMSHIRKIGATAVRAMEQHGAVRREHY